MSYQLEIAKNGHYLICRVTRPIATDLARQFSIAMDQVSRARKIKRFLVDVRGAPNVATVFQNYEYANKDVGNLDLQRDVRSAILANPGQIAAVSLLSIADVTGVNNLAAGQTVEAAKA